MAEPVSFSPPASGISRIVVIGAGECAARAVGALREHRFAGTITMLGNENTLPYERPPLSKGAVIGGNAPKPTVAMSEARLNELDIAFAPDDPAVSVDRAERLVLTASGQTHYYDRLLFATGARSRELPFSETFGVLTLRTVADASRLHSALSSRSTIAIIGGGFIGLEVAASVRSLGTQVIVIELGERTMGRAVPASVASLVEHRHRREGVDLRLAVGVTSISRKKNGRFCLTLTDSSQVVADVVLAGIGAIPETELAESCGLTIDNGIVADEYLRTSDPVVFAAGDCVNFPHSLYGGRRVRLEAWQTAHDHGVLAGINMLNGHQVADSVPWFWSSQYDLTISVMVLPSNSTSTNMGGSWQLQRSRLVHRRAKTSGWQSCSSLNAHTHR
jgi:3-phenylpropionate/trans-cinnamate dioxygenase ferredoxin reductase component